MKKKTRTLNGLPLLRDPDEYGRPLPLGWKIEDTTRADAEAAQAAIDAIARAYPGYQGTRVSPWAGLGLGCRLVAMFGEVPSDRPLPAGSPLAQLQRAQRENARTLAGTMPEPAGVYLEGLTFYEGTERGTTGIGVSFVPVTRAEEPAETHRAPRAPGATLREMHRKGQRPLF